MINWRDWMKKSIMGCGFSCIDIISTDNKMVCDVGGTCANVLSVLSFLGWDSVLWLPDYEDDRLNMWLQETNIQCVNFMKTKKQTPKIIQVYDYEKGKHRFFTRCPWCGNRFFESILPNRKQAILKTEIITDIFFCDRISDGIMEIANRTKANGGITMYEPNGLRFYNQFIDICRKFDIIKFSDERIPDKWQEQLMEDLMRGQTKLVIVTLGERGLKFILRTEDGTFSEWNYMKSYEADGKRDSSGAGDWLTATFLYYFIPQLETYQKDFPFHAVWDSLLKAVKMSAFACKEVGAQGLMHSKRGIEEVNQSFDLNLYPTNLHNEKREDDLYCGKCRRRLVEVKVEKV